MIAGMNGKTVELEYVIDELNKLKAALQDKAAESGVAGADIQFQKLEKAPAIIDSLRISQGMHKRDLALMAEVTQRTLRRFENDIGSMRLDTIQNILDVFGLTLYVGHANE